MNPTSKIRTLLRRSIVGIALSLTMLVGSAVSASAAETSIAVGPRAASTTVSASTAIGLVQNSYIINYHTGECLHDSGIDIYVFNCENISGQHWRYVWVSVGWEIQNTGSNLCLAWTSGWGAPVAATCTGNHAQLFNFYSFASDPVGVLIKNYHTGLCLGHSSVASSVPTWATCADNHALLWHS
jgi:hypothetical protein